MRTIKQKESIEAKLEKPCFFCGNDEVLRVYVRAVNKAVCILCEDSEEVKQFTEMKEKQGKWIL